MKTNEKKIKVKQVPQREEWIFAKDGECPENQIEFCYLYEFAREAWRAGYGGDRDPLHRYGLFMRHFPQWRTVPYLAVPVERREEALAAVHKETAAYDEWIKTKIKPAGPGAPVDNLRDQHGYQDTVTREHAGLENFNYLSGKAAPEQNITRFKALGLPISVTTWFVHEIKWGYNDANLIKHFTQWLLDHRKDRKPNAPVDTRRESRTCEKLTRLAVWRLNRACGYKGAKEAIKAATKDGESVWNPYTTHESWCRAARQAHQDLEEFIYNHCETDLGRFTSKKLPDDYWRSHGPVFLFNSKDLPERAIKKAVAEYLKTHC